MIKITGNKAKFWSNQGEIGETQKIKTSRSSYNRVRANRLRENKHIKFPSDPYLVFLFHKLIASSEISSYVEPYFYPPQIMVKSFISNKYNIKGGDGLHSENTVGKLKWLRILLQKPSANSGNICWNPGALSCKLLQPNKIVFFSMCRKSHWDPS